MLTVDSEDLALQLHQVVSGVGPEMRNLAPLAYVKSLSGTRYRDEDKKRQRACGTEKELAVSALLEQANSDAASQCGVRFGVGPTGAPTDQCDSLRHDVFRQLLLRWFCKDFTSFCRF
ncbi:hypothetical protein JEQ12_019031 [Ovis aries]|uniref:Uncharacterized protein n=1 Tax=Ovis aries TaxID=9940 RepID=A0A836A1T2_SHEEP|nr:hypothetical protein JEQ12_019031 [Ovis aries]